jgi:predicted nucleic acid-binding protein
LDNRYFDSATFLSILNGEPTGPQIKALLSELKKGHCKVHTSIITVQEISVVSFKSGTLVTDNHSKISKLARIQGMSREVALTAAKLEAHMINSAPVDPKERQEENKRRKWDCFHVATALELHCSTFYTADKRLLAFGERLGIRTMRFSEPIPSTLPLNLEGALIIGNEPTKGIEAGKQKALPPSPQVS